MLFCFAIRIYVENNVGGYPLFLLNVYIIEATDTVFFFQPAYPFKENKILEAAETIFAEKGFTKAKMKEIEHITDLLSFAVSTSTLQLKGQRNSVENS